jgi:hypothetical protein
LHVFWVYWVVLRTLEREGEWKDMFFLYM